MALIDPSPISATPTAVEQAAYDSRRRAGALAGRIFHLLTKIEEHVAAAGGQSALLTELGDDDGNQLCDAHAKLLTALAALDPNITPPTAFPASWP